MESPRGMKCAAVRICRRSRGETRSPCNPIWFRSISSEGQQIRRPPKHAPRSARGSFRRKATTMQRLETRRFGAAEIAGHFGVKHTGALKVRDFDLELKAIGDD